MNVICWLKGHNEKVYHRKVRVGDHLVSRKIAKCKRCPSYRVIEQEYEGMVRVLGATFGTDALIHEVNNDIQTRQEL